MVESKLLKTGIVGALVTAVCCFTPILVVVLGALGLSAALGLLDYVLIPALVFFIGLTAYAYVKSRRRAAAQPGGPSGR